MVGGIRKIARGESNIDFVGRTKVWLAISGLLMIVSIGGLGIRHLNLGLSFKGGTSLRAPLNTDVTVPQIRKAFQGVALADAEVQILTNQATNKKEVLVQSKHLSSTDLQEAQSKLVTVAGLASKDEVNVDDVGPKWGQQISKKALQGLIVFMILVIAYISFRFEPKMAAAAVVALIHDLLATAGIYAIVGFEVTPATVVAVLTILGYSLYDTVVVFDKVRENAEGVVGAGRMTYGDMVNKSVNQVLMRSINTSLTSLIPVGALLLVGAGLTGAEQLKDLALALLIGILVGTYSSIFVASPLLALWKEREPRYKAVRAKLAKGAPVGRTPALAGAGSSMPAAVPGTNGDEPEQRRPITSRPSQVKGRKKRGGKRKR